MTDAGEEVDRRFREARDRVDRSAKRPERTGNANSQSKRRSFTLVPYNAIIIGCERTYLVKGIIPRAGLTVIWGPPKCGKSFWTFDLAMHIALEWPYRERRVQQGPVVYLALEGGEGFRARLEAFRRHHNVPEAPFFLITDRTNLVADHALLIKAIGSQLSDRPTLVVIDTLNRSLVGSESKDEDMAKYIQAADAVREAFRCAVAIVHHCGVDDSRPRGHTSLTGAADAQLAVTRDASNNIVVEVEWMKDGLEGDTIVSKLETVNVGTDADGDAITSCVIVPTDPQPQSSSSEPKLTRNQKTMFAVLHAAGPSGLTTAEWNERARDAGIGTSRKADLYDFRAALKAKRLVREYGDRWTISS